MAIPSAKPTRMPAARLPANEEQRLRSLASLGVLDTAAEREFDALVEAAALVCGAPISLISLVDQDRQWFKANVGLPGVSQTPRDLAFCAHAILGDEVFEVTDATLDPRFEDNGLVTQDPHIRFYAGAPLRLADGTHAGTLCVIGRQPQQLNDTQRRILVNLAAAAVQALEGRRALQAERQLRDSLAHKHASLAESEARFRALSAGSPLGVYATDAIGACTYTNERWQQIFGLSMAESLGLGWTATLHPDDSAGVYSAWHHAASSGGEFDQEFRIRRADGSQRTVRSKARAALGESGAVVGYVGSVEDVTDAKALREDLANKQQRLADILEGTGAGTWEWNVQTGQTRFNERWAQVIGYTLDELEPVSIQTWMSHAHPDDLAHSGEQLQRHFVGETPHYECEARMRHRDGHWVWVLDRGRVLTRTADGQPEWMFGTHIDISERKRHESELEEANARMGEVFLLSSHGFANFDTTGTLTYCNPQVGALLGLDVQPGLTLAALDERLASVRQGAETWVATAAALPPGESRSQRLSFTSPRVRVVDCTLRRTPDNSRVILFLRDITHESEVERLKSEFLSTAAHELRTPMTSVYGFSELLLTRELPEPIRRKVLENIHRQASSLVVMVNDLLDLARIEARQHKEVRRAPHSLRSLVEPVVDGLLVNGDERRARMDIGTAEHTVNVDDDKFRRALTNVLSNAFKYSPQGGEVVVSTQVGKGIRDGLLGLCVTDHGVGMSPENCRRVFERFFRADPSGAIPGTGLGMSLVKEIVELHGGEVDVASELGHGTSVTLWWPLANA